MGEILTERQVRGFMWFFGTLSALAGAACVGVVLYLARHLHVHVWWQ